MNSKAITNTRSRHSNYKTLTNLLKIRGLKLLRQKLLAYLNQIDPKSIQGQKIIKSLSDFILDAPENREDNNKAAVIINVLQQLRWIKCYFRAVSDEEFFSLRDSKGEYMFVPEGSNFCPDNPNHPIITKYVNEYGYSGDIVMIFELPGSAIFHTEPDTWPRLKQSGRIPGKLIWFLSPLSGDFATNATLLFRN
jgi:hypothetical protein